MSEVDKKRDDYLNFVLAIYQILSEPSWIKSDPENIFFPIFLTQVRKHAGLAILSVARHHSTQAMLNLRYVIESAEWMFYSMVRNQASDFYSVDTRGAAIVTENHKNRMYDWAKEHYPAGCLSLKKMKNHINESQAHADIIYAQQNVDFKKYEFKFFDLPHARQLKANFFYVGMCIWQILDLLYGINQDHTVVQFSQEFQPTMKSLKERSKELAGAGIQEAEDLGFI